MNVRELIEHLKTLPPEAEVGRAGHYGEFHPMDKYDFHKRTLDMKEEHWQLVQVKPFDVVVIEPPEIGPDPD